MPKSSTVFLTFLLIVNFSIVGLAQNNIRLFKETGGEFQVSVPADWKELKTGKDVYINLESPVSAKTTIFIERNILGSAVENMSLKELSEAQLDNFKEEEKSHRNTLNKGVFLTINGVQWWMIDYISSKGTRYQNYQTIRNKTRYCFYYTSPGGDFDKANDLAVACINTFVFLSKDNSTVQTSPAAPKGIGQTTAPADSRSIAADNFSGAKQISFDAVFPFKDGLAIVKKGQSTAVINPEGKVVIDFNKYIFDDFNISAEILPTGFYNGSCVVRSLQNGKLGLIDKDGNFIIPAEYLLIYPFDEDGWAKGVDYNHAHYFINRKGSKIPVADCFLALRNPQGWGLSPSGGMEDLFRGGAQQKEAFGGRVNLAVFDHGISPGTAKDGKAGFFDRNGIQVIAPIYNSCGPFNDGLAFVSKNDEFGKIKYGYIDRKGNTVIPFKFSRPVGNFNSGLAFVQTAGGADFTFGFIDKTGNPVIKLNEVVPQNDGRNLPAFDHGYFIYGAQVKGVYHERITIIDASGNLVLTLPDGSTLKHKSTTTYMQNYRGMYDTYKDNYRITGKILFYNDPNGRLSWCNLVTKETNTTTFMYLSEFDPVSGLAFFQAGNNRDFKTGYIDLTGKAVLVNSPEKSIF